MHIVIDDTYGPEAQRLSKYVSGERRTHVAVIFKDENVQNFREQIRGCLEEIGRHTSNRVAEFHFECHRGQPLKKDIANGEWGQSLKGDKFNIWPNQLIQRTR